jgi:ribonuclease HI
VGRLAGGAGALRSRPLKVYFDGGCRPNPGPIEVAVVARGEVRFFDGLGAGTSEDAEWLALRLALRVAQSLAPEAFDLIGDNAHVIAQANGAGRCRGRTARDHYARFQEDAASAPPRRIRWSPRNQNLAGIALARRA